MNEVARVHLARVSYEIDVNAKKELERYLTAVRKSLGDEVDAMEDIEIRMTEILAERGVIKDSVVTENDIKVITAQLGEPKEFSSDDKKSKDTKSDSGPHPSFTKNQDGSTKKFYRDTDNAVLGGVCAGLAAYTGWDVTIIRVLTVVLTIVPSFGMMILVYIVVWFCAPEANSVSEKLEMRGEPVDIESIKKTAAKIGHEAEKKGKEMAAYAKTEIDKKASTVGRIFAVFFGCIGLLVALSLMGALVLASNRVLFAITAAAMPYQTLLIVAVSLVVATLAFIVLLLLVSSIGGLIGAAGKGFKRSLIALTIIVVLLMVGATAVASSWVSMAGRDGVYQVVDVVKDGVNKKSIITTENGWCIGVCI